MNTPCGSHQRAVKGWNSEHTRPVPTSASLHPLYPCGTPSPGSPYHRLPPIIQASACVLSTLYGAALPFPTHPVSLKYPTADAMEPSWYTTMGLFSASPLKCKLGEGRDFSALHPLYSPCLEKCLPQSRPSTRSRLSETLRLGLIHSSV